MSLPPTQRYIMPARVLTLTPGTLQHQYATALLLGEDSGEAQKRLGITRSQAKRWHRYWRDAVSLLARDRKSLSYAIQVIAQPNHIEVTYPAVGIHYRKVDARKYETTIEIDGVRTPVPTNSESMSRRYVSKM